MAVRLAVRQDDEFSLFVAHGSSRQASARDENPVNRGAGLHLDRRTPSSEFRVRSAECGGPWRGKSVHLSCTPHSALGTANFALRTPHFALRTPHSALRTRSTSPIKGMSPGVPSD